MDRQSHWRVIRYWSRYPNRESDKDLSKKGLNQRDCRREQKKRRQKIIDGEKEAYLVAIAISETPCGKSNWTLKMLADKMVELNYVEQVSTETIRKTLKKTNLNCGRQSDGPQLEVTSSLRPDLG